MSEKILVIATLSVEVVEVIPLQNIFNFTDVIGCIREKCSSYYQPYPGNHTGTADMCT